MTRLLLAFAALVTVGAAPAPSCDRACLTSFADRYMDALAAKAPNRLPWAERVAYTENGVSMMIGDALWGSVSAHGKGMVAADPAAGQVAWFGRVDEHGQPAFYAMRLKVTAGRIAEVETVVRRKEGRPPFGDPAAFPPSIETSETAPRARIQAVADKAAPLAPGCTRSDNGVPSKDCREQFASILRKRVALVDAERGLAVVIGHKDYAARDPARSPTKYPFSLGFMALVQVRGGAVARIDEVASEVSYRMPDSWAK